MILKRLGTIGWSIVALLAAGGILTLLPPLGLGPISAPPLL